MPLLYGDAVSEVVGQMKCALALVTFEKPPGNIREAARRILIARLRMDLSFLVLHVTATIPNIRDVIQSRRKMRMKESSSRFRTKKKKKRKKSV